MVSIGGQHITTRGANYLQATKGAKINAMLGGKSDLPLAKGVDLGPPGPRNAPIS